MDSTVLVTVLALLIATAAYVALDIMGLFSFKNHFPIDGRTAIITGGSSGLGRGLGKVFAEKGGNVIIVARNVQKLQDAVEYIKGFAKNPATQRFHYISADLTSATENTRVIAEATAWNGGLPPDVCWSNAGASHPMLFLDAPTELLQAQMEQNYLSAAYFCHAALHAWVKPRAATSADTPAEPLLPRHLVITSSSLAFCGVAGYGTYSPAKAALRCLSDSLRNEVNLYNGARRRPGADPASVPPADIKVASLYPGNILTPGYDVEEQTKHDVTRLLEEGDPRQTEDQVATKAVRELEKGGYLITTQYLAELMRISALQGSPRNSWIVDTIASWVTSIAWLFIGPDLESKVYNYGKKHGCTSEKVGEDSKQK